MHFYHPAAFFTWNMRRDVIDLRGAWKWPPLQLTRAARAYAALRWWLDPSGGVARGGGVALSTCDF